MLKGPLHLFQLIFAYLHELTLQGESRIGGQIRSQDEYTHLGDPIAV